VTDAELDQLVAEARDWQSRWHAGRVPPGTYVLIASLLDALAAVRGERDRMRGALEQIDRMHLMPDDKINRTTLMMAREVARQALGGTE
jgi:hypothetical protein